MELISIILDQMSEVSKSQKTFFVIIIKMFQSISGKINFRSLGRYGDIAEKTVRRWFKKPFDFAKFNAIAIQELESFKESICGIDACFLEKAGKLTYGLEHFWNGCASKAQKGLETSLASIINVTTKTAYPLLMKQTLPINEVRSLLGENATRIDFYIDTLKSIAEHIKKFTNFIVCDAFYTKKKFVDGVVDLGFTFIGKMRSDANLKKIFIGEQASGPGRPKKFAGKCNLETLDDFEFEKNIDQKTNLHSGIFYSQSLEREVKVVAISDEKQETPVALLFSTDIQLSADAIYRYYVARFQIEFLLRDAQQFAGLGHFQCRNKESIDFHINISLASVNLAKIEDRLAMLNQQQQSVFSMHNHKVKNHNKNLISRFFSMLDYDLPSINFNGFYSNIIAYGANLNTNF